MAEQVCGSCALWNSTPPTRCRLTGAARTAVDTCSLTPTQRLTLLRQARAILAANATGTPVVIESVTSCGAGHVFAVVTLGGRQRRLTLGLDELRKAPRELEPETILAVLLHELISGAGPTSFATAKALAEGHTFWV